MNIEPETNRERLLVAEAIYKATADAFHLTYTEDIRRHPLEVIHKLHDLREVVRMARILAAKA